MTTSICTGWSLRRFGLDVGSLTLTSNFRLPTPDVRRPTSQIAYLSPTPFHLNLHSASIPHATPPFSQSTPGAGLQRRQEGAVRPLPENLTIIDGILRGLVVAQVDQLFAPGIGEGLKAQGFKIPPGLGIGFE